MSYNFKVIHGSIMNNATGCLIQEPGVLMMLDTGSPIKIGEYEWCEKYFNRLLEKVL